jgi:hypothetical protein
VSYFVTRWSMRGHPHRGDLPPSRADRVEQGLVVVNGGYSYGRDIMFRLREFVPTWS